MSEKIFYNELEKCPKIPEELFEDINRKISEKKQKRKLKYSIVASLIISFGIIFYNLGVINNKTEIINLSQESNNELQVIDEYLSGRSIDNEFEDLYYSFLY